MTWDEQDDGSYLGVVSDKAATWAGGDPERIAWAGFIEWCRAMKLDPKGIHPAVTVPPDWRFTVMLDRSTDFEKFAVDVWKQGEGEEWVAVVRLMDFGPIPLAHILGLSAIIDQIQGRSEPPHARHHLLTCREWLRAFPAHRVTTGMENAA